MTTQAEKDAEKAAAEAEASQPIQVRATRDGYFGDDRKREGDEFPIPNAQALGSWMERLDGKENPKAPKKK